MSYIPNDFPEFESLADLLPAFEFDRLIEQDATGVVYKACHRTLDRDVAIKILPCDSSIDPHFRNSFEANAKAMARLAHPSLIRVYDCGDLDGRLYTVMEYVPGKSLLKCARGIAIDPMQAVEILISACQGLAHAHENGIVHGDIQPANILLTRKCEPKIGNFGHSNRNRKNPGVHAAGIDAYTAPEVLAQHQNRGLESDVYALGVVLQEMLTGIPAGSADQAIKIAVDPALDAICRKATHPDPASRFVDASSLADQLDIWLTAKKAGKSTGVRQLALTQRPTGAQGRAQLPARGAQSSAAPALAGPRPTLASFNRQGPSGSRALLKFWVIVPLLLSTMYMAFGFYQEERTQAGSVEAERSGQAPGQPSDQQTGRIDGATLSRQLAVAGSGATR